MAHKEIHKQISVFLSLPDWRVMRDEAARRGIPITELAREWMRSHLEELKANEASPRV